MTAKEQIHINEDLNTLGIAPLIMQVIPISIVHEGNIIRDSAAGEPTLIISDSKGNNNDQGIPTETRNNPEVQSEEINPSSAMVVYSEKVNDKRKNLVCIKTLVKIYIP